MNLPTTDKVQLLIYIHSVRVDDLFGSIKYSGAEDLVGVVSDFAVRWKCTERNGPR